MSELNRQIAEIPPIEYSLNFDWGSFSVSKLAHETYGLTPFRPVDVQDDPGDPTSNYRGYKIDTLLAVPGEYNIPDVPIMGGYINSHWDKEKLSVVVAVGGDMTSMTDTIMSSLFEEIAKDTDMDVDDIREHLTDLEGKSINETLGYNVPQFVAHLLSSSVGTEVKNQVYRKEQELARKNNLRRFKILGATSVVGAGLIAASVPIIASGSFDPFILSVADVSLASFVGMQSYTSYSEVKKYINRGDQGDLFGKIISSVIGQKVTTGIHESYCRRHFDKKTEEKLG